MNRRDAEGAEDAQRKRDAGGETHRKWQRPKSEIQ